MTKLKSPSKTKKNLQLLAHLEPGPDDIVSVKTEKQADAHIETSENTLTISAIHDNNSRLVGLCFNNYRCQAIPRVIMQVLGLILPNYTKLNTLKIKDCYIDKYTIYELSKILSTTMVTDVCLDSSSLPEANYDVLLQKSISLRNLSLKSCKINDGVCKRIVSQLKYSQPAERTLVALNLSSNFITDVGAEAVGETLRNNRCLRYLNLADNQISDEGASHIFDVLKEFPLTCEEIVNTRMRRMQYLKNKLVLYNKCVQELENKSVVESTSKRSVKKKRTSAISLKSKSSDRKGERRSGGEEYLNDKAELMAAELIGPFNHPFNKYQVVIKNNYNYCIGNFVLCYLNLAYNDLTYLSLKKINDVLMFQRIHKNEDLCGLINVVLEGNYLPVNCKEMMSINEQLTQIKKQFSGGKFVTPEKGSARRKSVMKPIS